MARNKNLKILIFDNFLSCHLILDGNETLYSHRTWKYIAKTEVEFFLTVIVFMVTV